MHRKFILIIGLLLAPALPNASFACTSIYIVKDSMILAGKNQDFGEWRTMLGFTPAGNGRFGTAYFGGKSVFPTGGINSEGLFFELHQGEFRKKMTNVQGKLVFAGNLIDKLMSECSTVQNVIDTLKRYTQEFLFYQNIAFGDKTGNSIILEGDTIITRKGNYQICTNFYQSLHDRSDAPCWRYKNVDERIRTHPPLTVDLISEALSVVRNPIFTQYSVIYDLKKGIIYLYFYRDFEHVRIFKLQDEFQKAEHVYNLPELFPDNKAYNDTYVKRQTPINNLIIAVFSGFFIILSIASFFLAFTLRLSKEAALHKRRLSILSRLTLGLVSILSLIYLSRFLGDPESLQIGLFHPIKQYYSSWSLVILHIPKLLILAGTLMIISSFLHWKMNIYSIFIRIYCSVYTALVIIMITLFAYWGFIIPA